MVLVRRMRGRIVAALAGLVACMSSAACAAGRATQASEIELAAPVPPAVSTEVDTSVVTFAFGGDVHAVGALRERLLAQPQSWLTPIAPVLGGADLAIVNLETAVTNGGKAAQKEYSFRAPPEIFTALQSAGVDAASLANNHGLDYGASGFADTLAAASAAGFSLLGVGTDERTAYAPWIVQVGRRRIAVFAASQVIPNELFTAWVAKGTNGGMAAGYDAHRLGREIAKVRADVDTVVVYLHWGEELARCATQRQQTTAATLIAAGADLVVGAHSHRVQGAGRVGNGLVAYGLGNFVWYNESGDSGQSGVLLVTAAGRTILDYRWVPARIRNGIPIPLEGEAAASDIEAWAALRSCSGLAA